MYINSNIRTKVFTTLLCIYNKFNIMKATDSKQQLFEMMGKLNPSFKPGAKLLTEWNFDKKKGEDDKDEDKEEKKDGKKKWNFEKKEDTESKEHEESETPEEEKKEHKEKKELDEVKPNAGKKIPVNAIAKVGGK